MGLSESVNRGKTDKTMAKRKGKKITKHYTENKRSSNIKTGSELKNMYLRPQKIA